MMRISSPLIEHHQVNGKSILVLEVRPGSTPPYGIVVDKGSRNKPEYYARRGASTFHAQPAEFRDAARSRP
jgi:predicted HTH transcriptional regulator